MQRANAARGCPLPWHAPMILCMSRGQKGWLNTPPARQHEAHGSTCMFKTHTKRHSRILSCCNTFRRDLFIYLSCKWVDWLLSLHELTGHLKEKQKKKKKRTKEMGKRLMIKSCLTTNAIRLTSWPWLVVPSLVFAPLSIHIYIFPQLKGMTIIFILSFTVQAGYSGRCLAYVYCIKCGTISAFSKAQNIWWRCFKKQRNSSIYICVATRTHAWVAF